MDLWERCFLLVLGFAVGVLAGWSHLANVAGSGVFDGVKLVVLAGWAEEALDLDLVGFVHSDFLFLESLVLHHVLDYQVLYVAWEVLDVKVTVYISTDLVILYKLGKHVFDVYLAVGLLRRLGVAILQVRATAVIQNALRILGDVDSLLVRVGARSSLTWVLAHGLALVPCVGLSTLLLTSSLNNRLLLLALWVLFGVAVLALNTVVLLFLGRLVLSLDEIVFIVQLLMESASDPWELKIYGDVFVFKS